MQENKMGTMPVHRLLITMSVPLMISMLVQALYNIVDSMFVAMINEDALTAVSLAFPMQNLMIAVATGTGVGVNALISRRLGQKQQEMANRTANNAIFLAICSYIVFLLIGIFASTAFMRAQAGGSERIIEYGSTYLRIICILWHVWPDRDGTSAAVYRKDNVYNDHAVSRSSHQYRHGSDADLWYWPISGTWGGRRCICNGIWSDGSYDPRIYFQP